MARQKAIPTSGLLDRWSRFAVRRRGLVVLGWVGMVLALVVLAGTAGGRFANDFAIPGSESQAARDLLDERFPEQAGDSARLVFRADRPLTSPELRARVEAVVSRAGELPGVIGVASPFEAGAVSADGRIAYATVQYAERATQVPKADAWALLDFADDANGDGLTVEVGGFVVEMIEQVPPGTSEAIGLLAAMVILLVAFGSVVAMGLPLTTALIGLGVSITLAALSRHFLAVPEFSTAFVGMIGLGVGIDYALFIVTRYREGLRAGMSVEDSVVLAVGTAGRAVAFAGGAVAIALLGLLAIGILFVSALGVVSATVVAVAVIVALTLLPALLAFTGRRIDRWSIPFLHATDSGDRRSVWYRLAMKIQRRPLPYLVASLAALVLLALPVVDMRLGSSDAGNAPTSLHSRRAYDLLAKGFGPGFNGPLLVVVDLEDTGGASADGIERVRQALAAWPGVAHVSPPLLNPAGDAAIITAVPATAPQDPATQQLVHDLRALALPPVLQETGTRAYVAGQTAGFIDVGDRIQERLPLFFAAVIGLSFLLLMAVFRSALVALKAAVMNLLSIGAAYGVIVAVFQWGWLEGWLGVKAGPIESFLPMMLFAVLFGLSMDYEVFLISRIRERYLQTGDNAEAVAHGLTATARVITAAAVIMVTVFLSFALNLNRIVKEFGLGLATAIFVDATIVRLLLVPATMELLGKANWWLPRWLGRLLPRLDVEGTTEQETEAEAYGLAAD